MTDLTAARARLQRLRDRHAANRHRLAPVDRVLHDAFDRKAERLISVLDQQLAKERPS